MNKNLFKFKAFFDCCILDVSGFDFDKNIAFIKHGGFVDLDLSQIMQYTGFEAATNDQEIFTGMIIQNQAGEQFEVIQGDSGEFLLSNMEINEDVSMNDIDLFKCEIIGTIWDK